MKDIIEQAAREAVADWWAVGRELHKLSHPDKRLVSPLTVLERIIVTRFIEALGGVNPADPVDDQIQAMRRQRAAKAKARGR